MALCAHAPLRPPSPGGIACSEGKVLFALSPEVRAIPRGMGGQASAQTHAQPEGRAWGARMLEAGGRARSFPLLRPVSTGHERKAPRAAQAEGRSPADAAMSAAAADIQAPLPLYTFSETDPMCTQPLEFDGTPVACRTCDECVGTRIADWLGRAAAESAVAGSTVALRLSYRNLPDGSLPSGARAFQYRDVQRWLYALRQAYFRRYNARGEIRYIVAGEKGSRNDRVHFHVILWADRPIGPLGKWTNYVGRSVSLKEGLPPQELNLHWSLWPHGTVYLQRPGERGLRYALKYALKYQFNVVQSKGKAREAKAENYAASLFRMSKKPPIGWRFLQKRLGEMERDLWVPVRPYLKVPGLTGYWWPKGDMREEFLTRLHAINEKRRSLHGRNCAGWSSLLAAVSEENETDWEALTYGNVEIPPPSAADAERDFEQFREQLRRKGAGRRTAAIVHTCGRGCAACRNSASDADRRADATRAARWYAKFLSRFTPPPGEDPEAYFEEWLAHRVPRHWCADKRRPHVRAAFGRVRALRRSERKASGFYSRRQGSSDV